MNSEDFANFYVFLEKPELYRNNHKGWISDNEMACQKSHSKP